jgi:hypothetical protein
MEKTEADSKDTKDTQNQEEDKTAQPAGIPAKTPENKITPEMMQK